jgi:hypothetical protein
VEEKRTKARCELRDERRDGTETVKKKVEEPGWRRPVERLWEAGRTLGQRSKAGAGKLGPSGRCKGGSEAAGGGCGSTSGVAEPEYLLTVELARCEYSVPGLNLSKAGISY